MAVGLEESGAVSVAIFSRVLPVEKDGRRAGVWGGGFCSPAPVGLRFIYGKPPSKVIAPMFFNLFCVFRVYFK